MGDATGENPPAVEGGKRSAWMSHVKKTMKAHKGMKLMQVLKLAKKTYKKSRGGGASSAAPGAGSAATVGGRRRRTSKKTRKGSRKH